MAFPGNTNRYVLSGGLPGGERWSIGFYGEQTPDPASAQNLADQWGASGSTSLAWMVAIGNLNPSQFTFTRIQVYTYGVGRTIIGQGEKALNVGGTGAPVHPNQIAVVLTLRTALASRRGRGRMYVPALTAPMQTNGLAVQSNIQALVTATAPMLDTYNAEVVSEAGGLRNRVNRVDADLVLDQQTSRRDKLVSTRVSAVVPGA